jgi:hypothetical protein
MEESLMETKDSNKNRTRSRRSMIITVVVSCLLTGIGILTVSKIKFTHDNAESYKNSASYTDIFENEDNTYSKDSLKVNDDNPLNHLKLLKEDMEAFRALVDEVMKESFVTET